MKDTKELLEERNETHGSFIENSEVSQAIKEAIRNSENWIYFEPIHKEALEYIAGKIGRLCAGDFKFDDTWQDISGYAELPIKFKHGEQDIRDSQVQRV